MLTPRPSITALLLLALPYLLAALCSAEKLEELHAEIHFVPCEKFVQNGDFVHVYYTGRLYETKQQFDSNKDKEPFRITVGAGQVIEGWEHGLLG